MNATAKLYGICRELGYCVDDCDLCDQIAKGVRGPVIEDEDMIFTPEDLADDELKLMTRGRGGQTTCTDCGKIKRANHNCRAVPGVAARRVPRELPKATPVTWDDAKLKMCGWCRRKVGGHYAWCQEK